MILDRQQDMHIHCSYNDHSDLNLTVPNIIRTAEEKKLKKIAITEHVRRSSEWTGRYIEELNTHIPSSRVKILPGFEAKILQNGEIDCPQEYLASEYFIIASFHTKYPKDLWYSALIEVAKNPFVNVIGHLAPEVGFSLNDQEIEKLGELFKANDKIVELNSKYVRPPVKFLEIFKRQGVKFHLGSDAHSLGEIGNFNRINHLINLIEE
ncbi:PHP domain-containing protein [Candidatus Nitrosocosmicus franklandus]|uniref:DNA polymerase/3'-5' exonuclease PolX n=1 Tax=Candidatus Nitrosocosmicus franklandianus TaxID=1798806 RepID=A0A484I577_9ARCH|nr:PHP domain-containing protein [Candidatus Nitrosocosmicus franklandus]VFJ12346.1 DNA polymerase/3'-5' exonuclease PolX [Candidatus Nitrosocosmicus franklandus]